MSVIKPELLEAVLRSPEAHWELRGVMRALLAEGHPREDLVNELMQFKTTIWDDDEREQDIDAINDVLADLTGYCAAHMRL